MSVVQAETKPQTIWDLEIIVNIIVKQKELGDGLSLA